MTLHVTIIGGGASGTLAAAHLLRRRGRAQNLRITLVECHNEIGSGIAYSTGRGCHLLNTRASNMSAFADEPGHFLAWLERQQSGSATPPEFVARNLYGRYLAELIAPEPHDLRTPYLRIVRQECTGLRVHDNGVEVVLDDGSILPSHFAILATGYCRGGSSGAALDDPWTPNEAHDPAGPVVLVGTGLTMVDMVLSLLDSGQTGPIHAISRRGFLPQPHQANKPMKLSAADIPIGSSVAYLLRWLRSTIAAQAALGGDWRDVIDGLRPHTQLLWRHLPEESRRRFIRHATTMWDTHRHRMPPSSARRIAEARASGLLRIEKGYFVGAERTPEGTLVTYRPARGSGAVTLLASRGIDCRGFGRLSVPNENRLVQSMLDDGLARVDGLGLGLDFDQNDALIGADGRSADRIFGIGPITRGTHWEITAVPDIREQAARLAALLLETSVTTAVHPAAAI